MRVPIIFILLQFVLTYEGLAQESFLLSEQTFVRQFLNFSPQMNSSGLKMEEMAWKLAEAKAPFQPYLKSDQSVKEFDEKRYYNKSISSLSVKTPFGIKLETAYGNNQGFFLNPENNLPANGMAYLGLDIPIGAGMMIDKDRANLKMAKIGNEASTDIYRNERNYYTFEALKVYWKWYQSYENLQLTERAVGQAKQRYEFTKAKSRLGKLAAVDTLEALINLQNRQTAYYESQMLNIALSNEVNKFIWDPQLMSKSLIPDTLASTFLQEMTAVDLATHPAIRLLNFDSMQLGVVKSLAREYMKPQIDVKLGTNQAWNRQQIDFGPVNNNFFVGYDFSLPILLRAQRSKQRQADLQLAIVKNEKDQMIRSIRLNQTILEKNNVLLNQNAQLLSDASRNYFTLLQAENEKFRIGESSLFVVNNRELKWMDAQQKFFKAYAEYRLALNKRVFITGNLAESYELKR